MSIFTPRTAKYLALLRLTVNPIETLSIRHYLATYYHLDCPQLGWCSGCAEHHSQHTICLSESLLPEELSVIMLINLLDNSLTFSWHEMEHFKVLELCDFFRLKQSYVLPMFKTSLRYKYALFHEEYFFLHYIFRSCISNSYALAAFLKFEIYLFINP